jgi:hypothetical protein
MLYLTKVASNYLHKLKKPAIFLLSVCWLSELITSGFGSALTALRGQQQEQQPSTPTQKPLFSHLSCHTILEHYMPWLWGQSPH